MTTTVIDLTALEGMSGHDLGVSEWLLIDQARIDRFADATDDHQWIHVDPRRAADGPFGATVAHGYLTLSLVIPLLTQLLVVERRRLAVNYGLNKVRFPSPVRAGSRIRLAGTIAKVSRVSADGVELAIDLTVELEGSPKPACAAQSVMRFYD
jgi:acyl dehydratase